MHTMIDIAVDIENRIKYEHKIWYVVSMSIMN